jgi:hypothetical protein
MPERAEIVLGEKRGDDEVRAADELVDEFVAFL